MKPIAIVGYACRLPDAENADAFWNMLIEGRSNYRELPPERLNQELYFSPEKGVVGKTYSNVGSYFNYQGRDFKPKRQLLSDDEGQHAAWETAMDAIQNAGYNLDAFKGKRGGVYIGVRGGSQVPGDILFVENVSTILEYLDNIKSVKTGNLGGGGGIAQIIKKTSERLSNEYAYAKGLKSGRYMAHLSAWNIAHSLGFDGPALIMDGACASSLSAVTLASRALNNGDIECAVVGGSNFNTGYSLLLFSKAQSICNLSCPFDESADGLVIGEAHVFFLLKTLEKALADGDTIHGVIRGIGVSTDGKGKSLWAPLAKGQTAAVLRAYKNGTVPENLRFIETHATSTHLGDATEVNAVGDALQKMFSNSGVQCPEEIHIGSVKANVGHTLNAAGAVGLLTALLVLKHKIVPPQINVKKRNKDIAWDKLPFRLADVPVKIKPNGKPLHIGIDSFGVGGINVYTAVEEWDSVVEKSDSIVPAAKQMPTPIAVVGMGCILPGAGNMDEFWNLLETGRDPKTEMDPVEYDRLVPQMESHVAPVLKNQKLRGGFIRNWKYDWKKHKVPPKQVAMANPLQFMILDAVDQALEHAGYKTKEFDRKTTSVFVGTSTADDFGITLQFGMQLVEVLDALKKVLQEENFSATEIEQILADYRQEFYTKLPSLYDEAGSFTQSSLASRITKTFDLMGGAIAIDSNTCSSTAGFAALDNAVKMLQSGECSMAICAAGQRSMGYTTFKEMAEYGSLGKGEETILPGEGVAVLILKSLQQAKTDGDNIHGIIHSIASSSGKDDVIGACTEKSLQNIGISQRDVRKSNITELAKQIGDIGVGLGIAELCKELLTMKNRKQTDCVSIAIKEEEESKQFSLAYNAVVSSADFSMDLLNDRRKTTMSPERNNVPSPLGGKVRVGAEPVNASSPTSLPQRGWGHRQPLTALMFPGQGAQYKGMLKSLYNSSADCREIIDECDETLKRLEYPTFAEMAWNESGALGKDVLHTQLSLLVADTVSARLLQKKGEKFSLVFGHSYGEYPALHIAGVWDFETAAVATKHRCDAIVAALGTKTGMLSTNANLEHLEFVLQKITSGKLYISNRNTPDQTVVSGELSALQELDAVLKQEHWMSLILPVPAGFHSPLVADVCEPLRQAIEPLDMTFPQTAFLSGVTGRFESEPATLKKCLVEQMIQPVDFVVMIRKAYNNGVRRFIEAGPKSLLCKMGAKILGESDAEFIATDLVKTNVQNKVLQAVNSGTVTVKRQMNAQTTTSFTETATATLEPPVIEKTTVKKSIAVDVPAALPIISPEEYRKLNTSKEGKEPISVPFKFNRFVMRLLEVPKPKTEYPLNGSVLIVAEEENDLARNFAEILAQNGVTFHVLPSYTPIDNIAAELEAFDNQKPVQHIVFMQPFNVQNETTWFQENRYKENTDFSFIVLQSWIRLLNAKQRDYLQCSVLGALNCGGDFGLARKPADVYSGALCGMLKALRMEMRAAKKMLRVKLIDTTLQDGITEITEHLFDEAIHWDEEYEIAYNNGQRFVVRPVLSPLNPDAPNSRKAADTSETWLITGGARGLTAAIAWELAKQRGAKLHLVGSSPLPDIAPEWKTYNDEQLAELKKEIVKKVIAEKQGIPAKIWGKISQKIEIDRNLEKLRKAGIAFEYHSCDLTDTLAVYRLVSEINEDITGVIHGAGIEQARSLEKKELKKFKETCDVKAKGAATLLDALTQQRKLPKVFVGFSSVSGRLGADGHSDYSAANELLVKTLDGYDAATECRAFCLQWPSWGEVGMATRGPGSDFVLARAGIKMMSPREGIPHCLNEIAAALDAKVKSNEREVLILNWDYYKRFYPDMPVEAVDTTKTFSLPTSSRVGDEKTTLPLVKHPSKGGEYPSPTALPTISPEEYRRLNTSKEGKEPIPVPFKHNRFVMRLMEVPEPKIVLPLNGSVLIIAEEENDLARNFVEILTQNGVTFNILPSYTPIENIAAELESFDNKKPVQHIVFMQSFNPQNETAWFQENRYKESTLVPFTVIQSWIRLLNAKQRDYAQCSVLGVLNCGGDFGLSRKVVDPYSGALSGLLKALLIEKYVVNIPMRVKLIDFTLQDSVAEIADCLFFETVHWDVYWEVAYNSGKRFALHPVLSPLNPDGNKNKKTVGTNETWLITGGARGITAAIALELGKQRGAKLHIVGSSPLPNVEPEWKLFTESQLKDLKKVIFEKAVAEKQGIPAKVWDKVHKGIEIDRNLDMLRKAGVAFEYHSCDVSDALAVHHLISEINEDITGVIHGAGFEQARTLEKKKLDEVKKTFDVKVKGAAHLMDEFTLQNKQPKVFVGFSSITGRFGAVGQIDYSSANELLVKMLDAYDASTECRAFCMQWSAWSEIGMASRPESKFWLAALDFLFMTPQEGTAHLLNEVAAVLDTEIKSKERELLIIDWKYYKQFHPDMPVEAAPAQKTLAPLTFIGENADTDALRNQEPTDTPTVYVTVSRDPRLSYGQQKDREWFITESFRQLGECMETAERSGVRCRFVLLTALKDYPAGQRFVDFIRNKQPANIDVEVIDLPADTAPEDVQKRVPGENNGGQDIFALIQDVKKTENGWIASGNFDPQKDVFLLHHRLNGKPIVPLVVILESFAEAFKAGSIQGQLSALENVSAIQGFICRSTNPYNFNVRCTPTQNGVQAELLGDFYNTAGKFVKNNLCYTKAVCTCSPYKAEGQGLHWQPISDDWYEFTYSNPAIMYHDKALQYLKRIHWIDKTRCIAEVDVPDTAELFGSPALTNGAVIDAAFYACGVLYYCVREKSVTIPRSIERLVFGPGVLNAGEKCFVHLQMLPPEESARPMTAFFDMTIRNQAGEIVYDLHRYQTDILLTDK